MLHGILRNPAMRNVEFASKHVLGAVEGDIAKLRGPDPFVSITMVTAPGAVRWTLFGLGGPANEGFELNSN
jgi:hypothetical protein